jgi:hypothetical protein
MLCDRVQDKRTGVGKNAFGVPDREQRSNPPALSSFASDLNGELNDRLAYLRPAAVKL